ncbi:polycystic kidney disease protein 1-like 2 [Penaeus chinensis]|uniref:polycystic kidney disease protein 1-like 2 n=1 Tax=Penaeus chinensis TaxID=139456 RepID=UPI001FB70016|nr:polycystic kidney disease protein 1-like 2 [Penaeus chinensis]
MERHDWITVVKDLPRHNDTYEWFFSNAKLKGEGSYFLGVGEFKSAFDYSAYLRDPENSGATKANLKNISVEYDVRIYTSGCYFYDEAHEEWKADGILANHSDLRVSRCESLHLTQFGAGLFVMPNAIDFTYTFAKIGFHDNVTIYATLIVLMVIFVVMMLWARFMDRRDVRKLGATPLPDNKVEDKYLYEVLVFTGNKKEAQTDSTVQFIVSGDRDESEVRTFGDEKRRIFRKGEIDVFVMAESRPLGNLTMMRIWHDNSGKGPNASWYLSFIVFRDVQTGEKYEFIANQWFAVEREDGQDVFCGGRPRRLQTQTVDGEILDKIRTKRKEELQIYAIVREIAFYSLFIWLILILSYGNRDPSAYLLQRSLREAFLYEGYLDGTDFTQVTNADRLWFYMLNGLFPKLRADVLYNGKPPYGLRGFLNDHSNRIMGYATIRQVRVREFTCRVPSVMLNVTRNCSGYSLNQLEDTAHYCRGWTALTPETVKSLSCQVPEFRYTTQADLKNNPVWGYRDTYGGGGYVIHLTGKTEDLLQNLKSLQKDHWIDRMTRAVIIEFSTYNAQVNLFGMSRIMAEFTPGGGVTPAYRFEGIRLINTSNFGLFVRICEIGFIFYVLYYTYREIRNMQREGWAYFQSYWSYADLAIICCSYSMIVIYLLRTYGNGYVNLQQAALLNEVYLYLIGFILFVGTIKFIKLLRFNRRMGVLSTTLRYCWEDLRGFLMVFVLCFFTFVVMFYMMLNSSVFGFHNFVVAVETCFSMILGKFQFEEMKEIGVFVTVMFFVFVICSSWVLINLLLTVVIQTFVEVRHALEKRGNEYELMQFFLARLRAFWGLEALPENGSPLLSCGTSFSGQDSLGGKNVLELPHKVDAFLDHLNQTYFNGQLDLDKKAFLGNRFRLGILNGDGDVTYPSGARRKPKGYPSYLRKEKAKRREEGREEKVQDEGRGGAFEVNYLGPRSVNRMQYELDDF